MSRLTAGSPLSRSVRKMARATASRGASSSTKRSPCRSCSVAPSPRIASVMRNPSRPCTPTTAVGWNWTNSRSASAAPASRASSRPEPNEPGGLVVRDHRAAAPPVARIVPRAASARPSSDAGAAAVRRPGGGAGGLQHLDRRVLGDVGGELAQDAAAGGAPAGVHDAAAPWPPSRPSARLPWRSASKRTPNASSSWKRAGASSVRTSAAERRTSSRPAASVSSRCSSGRVVDGERGGEPALGPVGRGLGERPRGHERDPGALAGRRQRGEQPGRTRADDNEIGAWGSRRGRTVPACLRLAAPRRLAAARHPRPSRAPRAHRRARGGDGPPRLVRGGAVRRRRSTASCSSDPPRAVRDRSRSCARAAAASHADTAAVPATFEAALRAAGGAIALVDGLLGGTPGRRLGAAAAGAPRRAVTGDGVLLLRQRGGRGAAGDGRARASSRC